MADLRWVIVCFGVSSALLAASFIITLIRRRRWRAACTASITDGTTPDCYLPPTIEDAERSMAVLLRRMRAYLHEPYNFAASRISDDVAFEDCLNRAAALGTRIAELGGAAPANQAERERSRGLILESLMISHRRTVTKTISRSGRVIQ